MKLWLISLTLITLATCLLPACREVNYDYNVLALTWPNEYCSEYTCDKTWRNSWDGKSLFIHGFWPSSTDLAFLSCFSQNGYDPFCFRQFKFNQSLFSKAELSDLNKYWPQIGTIKNFWDYEWSKHGTCYLYHFKDELKSNLTDSQIFKTYFNNIVGKVKNLKLSLTPGPVSTKDALGKSLGIKSNQFYAICGKDSELDEIRICYEIGKTPGQENIITCPKNTDKTQCKFPITIN